jgi:hypothetical protein
MFDDPELVARVVPEFDASGLCRVGGYEASDAVSVDALGIPHLHRRVCVQSQTSEHRVFGVTEDSGAFNAEYSSSKSLVTVLVDLSHELELSRQA